MVVEWLNRNVSNLGQDQTESLQDLGSDRHAQSIAKEKMDGVQIWLFAAPGESFLRSYKSVEGTELKKEAARDFGSRFCKTNWRQFLPDLHAPRLLPTRVRKLSKVAPTEMRFLPTAKYSFGPTVEANNLIMSQ